MSRKVSDLHPRLQEKVAELKVLCEKEKLNIGIGECLRTVAEQDALYAQGRTAPGSIVTNAKGRTYSSQHQWGIAFDFFKNIKGHEYDDLNFFNRVGALAKSIGLGWGGDWRNPVDRPHLYLPDWGKTTSKLKKEYGTPDKFMSTWNELAVEKIKYGPDTTGRVQTDGSNLRLRKEPNTDSEILERIPNRTSVDILEVGAEWHKIKFCGTMGYCMAKYIIINEVRQESVKFEVGKIYTLLEEMKVRSGPGTRYGTIRHTDLTVDGRKHDKDGDGALEKGTEVTCKEVSYDGEDIWVRTPSGWIAAVYGGKVYME